jgi:hypothetical protein
MDPVSITTSILREIDRKFSAKALKVNISKECFMEKESMSWRMELFIKDYLKKVIFKIMADSSYLKKVSMMEILKMENTPDMEN